MLIMTTLQVSEAVDMTRREYARVLDAEHRVASERHATQRVRLSTASLLAVGFILSATYVLSSYLRSKESGIALAILAIPILLGVIGGRLGANVETPHKARIRATMVLQLVCQAACVVVVLVATVGALTIGIVCALTIVPWAVLARENFATGRSSAEV